MQPYLFPYIGYFQLIHAVDAFVVYDDVNYIKSGWINRNYILNKDKKHLITLNLKESSPNKLICQILIGDNHSKILKTIKQNYSKAPQFQVVFPIIEDIFKQKEENLARFISYSLHKICSYIGLKPNWHISSELKKNNALRGENKVIAICKELGAAQYINATGGKKIYNQQTFATSGIKLSFIQPIPISYQQFNNPYVSNLSIIDIMMFNDQKQCIKLLKEYNIA